MDYHINKVQQYPFALFVTCPAEDSKIVLSSQVGNFVGDSTGLAAACAGSDEEIIGCGAFAGKVEHNYVGTVSFEGDFGSLKGEFFCG